MDRVVVYPDLTTLTKEKEKENGAMLCGRQIMCRNAIFSSMCVMKWKASIVVIW